jgi:hypothetical protein
MDKLIKMMMVKIFLAENENLKKTTKIGGNN